ncbi:hypothetical protein Tco_0466558 [Tanacetum coccineum]
MLHGILRFDEHPYVMMGFLRNIEGIGPLIRSLFAGIIILFDYFNKHYVTVIPLLKTYYVPNDWGTKVSDSRNELNVWTFSVTNETDGSGGEDGLVLILSELSFSSCSSPLGLLFQDLLSHPQMEPGWNTCPGV